MDETRRFLKKPPRGTVCALATLLSLSACKEENKPGPGDGGTGGAAETTRGALLSAAGSCVLTSAQDFQRTAAGLESAVAAFAASPEEGTRQAARTAFHGAMDSWQVSEVFQLGPAAPRSVAGGAELRDNIYSWPLVSRCAIEEQIVSKSYETPGFPSSLVSRRGLYALEYLLFYAGADTACPPTSPIVAGGTWSALSTEEREARKRAYAVVVAADVRRRADLLVEAWAADKGNFLRTLETAGSGNSVYPTSQGALNALSDALFYVEREVKDMKLARPLALRDCDSNTCPELLESQFAGRSKANVRANLVGFRRLVEGCGADYSGTGFDDLLIAVGSEPLAVALRERVPAAQAALEAVDEPDLREALAQDKASVRALYDAVKGVTDLLKVDLVTVLDLELPSSVEGDND
ncbi:imelysin family protein [Stigmatella sp. ncwal1]|uniref:Imelysin family protein n=1 Tax=Stigmatella ashevillensis TaxID=2995309 RepID=A0ABT5DCG5_9BACT|nr:imelysin family protein [Stigmatella ashevillena]MDC0711367.1 imelysin family protein [Stigmatella ashevillena]